MFAQISQDGVVSTAHRLAQESDRVLFIISLIVGLAFTYMVIKYLVKRNDEQQAKFEAMVHESNESRQQLAASMDRMSDNVESNTQLLMIIKSKVAPVVALALLLVGCGTGMQGGYKGWKWQAPVSVLQSEKTYAPGTNGPVLVSEKTYYVQAGTNTPTRWYVRNRAYTIADGKNNLTKVKTILTDKTISSGLDALDQESKGDVIPATVEKVGTAVPAIIKGAAGLP